MPIQSTCQSCGTTFFDKPSKKRTYCSRACQRPARPCIIQPDGTALIPLSKGFAATIDVLDIDKVERRRWYCVGSYAASGSRNSGTYVLMHRLIAACDKASQVDHINGDRLDNRRANLRCASAADNRRNARFARRGASGYRGVYPAGSRWMACITVDNRQRYIGTYDTKEEAARARDADARKLHGEFADLNFPDSQ